MDIIEIAASSVELSLREGPDIIARAAPQSAHYLADDFLPTLAKIMIAVPYELADNIQKLAENAQGGSLDLNILVIGITAPALLMVALELRRRI